MLTCNFCMSTCNIIMLTCNMTVDDPWAGKVPHVTCIWGFGYGMTNKGYWDAFWPFSPIALLNSVPRCLLWEKIDHTLPLTSQPKSCCGVTLEFAMMFYENTLISWFWIVIEEKNIHHVYPCGIRKSHP